MLFVLTGDVQTGKTRWLQALADMLRSEGITVYGVIAPGVWADRREDSERRAFADENGFEKLGIDNVLLPSGERIPFARRNDLAMQDASFDPTAQSAKAGLGWHISDEALQCVNDHLATMLPHESACCGTKNAALPGPGILIVDELGRLELERNQGLTAALALLDAGPQPAFQHAIIVVRERLLPRLEGRFQRWGDPIPIFPDAESSAAIMQAILDKQ